MAFEQVDGFISDFDMVLLLWLTTLNLDNRASLDEINLFLIAVSHMLSKP